MRRLAPLLFFALVLLAISCTHVSEDEKRLPRDSGAPSSTPGTTAGSTAKDDGTGAPSPGSEAGGTATGTTA